MANSKNLIARVSYGDLQVVLTAEGASWNPDVADDLIKRVNGLWLSALEAMQETGAWDPVTVEEED
jgi:hypothetical protein